MKPNLSYLYYFCWFGVFLRGSETKTLGTPVILHDVILI